MSWVSLKSRLNIIFQSLSNEHLGKISLNSGIKLNFKASQTLVKNYDQLAFFFEVFHAIIDIKINFWQGFLNNAIS